MTIVVGILMLAIFVGILARPQLINLGRPRFLHVGPVRARILAGAAFTGVLLMLIAGRR